MLVPLAVSDESLVDRAVSGDEPVHDIAVDVGQAEVAAIVAEGESLVIQAQQVEDGGMEVMMRDAVLYGVHAEFVGGTVSNPGLTPPPAIHMEKP